jgi:hypothetical protein
MWKRQKISLNIDENLHALPLYVHFLLNIWEKFQLD